MSIKNPSVLWTVDQGLEASKKKRARDNIGVKLDNVTTAGNGLQFVDDIPLSTDGDFTVHKKTVPVDNSYNAAGTNPVSGQAVADALSELEVLVNKDAGTPEAHYNEISAILGKGLLPVVYTDVGTSPDDPLPIFFILYRRSNCQFFFSNAKENRTLTLTWWTDAGTRHFVWDERNGVVHKEALVVTYGSTFVKPDAKYDTFVLSYNGEDLYDSFTGIYGSNGGTIWKSIRSPGEYYAVKTTRNPSDNTYTSTWNTYYNRITYSPTSAGAQDCYNKIVAFRNNVSTDIPCELVVPISIGGSNTTTVLTDFIAMPTLSEYRWVGNVDGCRKTFVLKYNNDIYTFTTAGTQNIVQVSSDGQSTSITPIDGTTIDRIKDNFESGRECNLLVRGTGKGSKSTSNFALSSVTYVDDAHTTYDTFKWVQVMTEGNPHIMTCTNSGVWTYE